MRIEGRRRGDDDEQGDRIGQAHADIGIDADPLELGARLLGRALQRPGMRRLLDLLDLLLGLPEEEIGTDRGAQDRHQRSQIRGRPGDPRDDQAMPDNAPRHVDDERHRDIGEQRHGQPFEHRDIARITRERLEQHRHQPEGGHIEERGAADQQLQPRPHRAEIGAEVDDVGDHHQQHDAGAQAGRVMMLEIAGDAAPGHPADPRADLLDRAHQRPGEEHHPGKAEAELRADLRVSGDAAGIVVRRASDEARPQHLEQFRPLGLLDVLMRVRRCDFGQYRLPALDR